MDWTDTYARKRLKEEFGLSEYKVEILIYLYRKKMGYRYSDYMLKETTGIKNIKCVVLFSWRSMGRVELCIIRALAVQFLRAYYY